MKKALSILFTLILSFGLVACGSGAPPSNHTLALAVTSETNACITTLESYKLKYTVNVGRVAVAIRDAENKPVTSGATFNSDSKIFSATVPKTYKLVVTATYLEQSKEEVVTVKVEEAEEVIVEKTNLSYPANPSFNALQARPDDFKSWTEFGAHDPSVIQVDGVYYAFSTDVSGTQKGYQIRRSFNGIHWNYIGSAFDAKAMQPSNILATNGGPIAEAWALMSNSNADSSADTRTGNVSLWAPDVVLGTDGMFWLYYCLTSNFGSSKSYIGLAKSNFVTGPYKHDSTLVYTTSNNSTQVNPIDPQIIYEENDTSKRMFMLYGSFFGGIDLQELDPATGRKLESEPVPIASTNGGFAAEGPVVSYHKVQVLNDVTGEYEEKGYYYLFLSAGSLTSTYNMRCFRSESITGPYVGVNGNSINALRSATAVSGNKVAGSFRFLYNNTESAVQPNDFYAPGHNDLFTTQNGVNLVVYHCRVQKVGDNMHYLYSSQYFFNENGNIVMNHNRYAGEGEALRKLTVGEIRGSEGALTDMLYAADYQSGAYKMVRLSSASTDTVDSVKVNLTAEAASGEDYNWFKVLDANGVEIGKWTLHGDWFVKISVGGEIYNGVAVPSWLTEQNHAGIAITALSESTGDAIYLNMAII